MYMKETVALAYSGGLDTTIAIKWIQERYNADVITVLIDVGQGGDLSELRQRAENAGAVKHYLIDARDEFVQGYVWRAIKANALYQEKYPLVSALSRPLIVAKLLEIAEKENVTAVAHGCTGKGNDQVRFDVTIKSLAPHLKIIAPIREWKLTRLQEIEYARARGIPVPVDADKPYSIDQNLWGRTIESGVLEHPDVEPPESAFEWTVSPEKAPNTPEYVVITFERGIPVRLNDVAMKPVELLKTLNRIAGGHAIGRIDHIEDRLIGIKSRELYECPAATVLLEAHFDLEKSVLTRHELSFKRLVDSEWATLVYTGLWMDPLREDLEAFIEETQRQVSGEVRLKLFKGGVQVVGRTSQMSLYDLNLASYGIDTGFDQTWSSGFIELWGLPTKVANILRQRRGKVSEAC
jgi:argininosuccinate synthase